VPGRIWYLVALGIFLVGMAAMTAFLITRLMSMDSGLTRFVVIVTSATGYRAALRDQVATGRAASGPAPAGQQVPR